MRLSKPSSLAAVGLLSITALLLPALAGTIGAGAFVPICDTDCTPAPGGGGGGGTPPPPPPSCSSGQNNAQTANFNSLPAVVGANDVATGVNGSVWYVTSGGTFNVLGGSIAKGGKRLTVDPSGNPWIVDFNGNIWRSTGGGQVTLLPGLARDIGIGANGAVWVIGTNSRNDSYQVWSWNGSSWIADPGSGEEIDVDAAGRPIVDGVDGKIWIKDGGANQGWSQMTGFADDMGVGPLACATGEPGTPGGPAFWIVGHLGGGGSVWNLFNGTWVQSTNVLSGVQQIAVDAHGTPGRSTRWANSWREASTVDQGHPATRRPRQCRGASVSRMTIPPGVCRLGAVPWISSGCPRPDANLTFRSHVPGSPASRAVVSCVTRCYKGNGWLKPIRRDGALALQVP